MCAAAMLDSAVPDFSEKISGTAYRGLPTTPLDVVDPSAVCELAMVAFPMSSKQMFCGVKRATLAFAACSRATASTAATKAWITSSCWTGSSVRYPARFSGCLSNSDKEKAGLAGAFGGVAAATNPEGRLGGAGTCGCGSLLTAGFGSGLAACTGLASAAGLGSCFTTAFAAGATSIFGAGLAAGTDFTLAAGLGSAARAFWAGAAFTGAAALRACGAAGVVLTRAPTCT